MKYRPERLCVNMTSNKNAIKTAASVNRHMIIRCVHDSIWTVAPRASSRAIKKACLKPGGFSPAKNITQ